MRRVLALASLTCVSLACASEAEIDPEEQAETLRTLNPPQVAFDPSNGVLVVPNTLGLISPTTGRLTLPPSAGETDAARDTRELTLNRLNGWPALQPQPIDIPLTEPVDLTSVSAQTVLVLNSTTGAPVAYTPSAVDSDGIPTLRLTVNGSLDEDTTYSVVVLDGLRAEGGEAFEANATWNLTRQVENPVQLDVSDDGDSCGLDSGGVETRFTATTNNTPFALDDGTDVSGNCLPSGLDSTGQCTATTGVLCSADTTTILGLDLLWTFHNLPLADGIPGFLPGVVAGLGAGGISIEREDILMAAVFFTQNSSDTLSPSVAGTPAAAAVSEGPTLVAPLDLVDSDPSNGFADGPNTLDIALCGAQGAAPGCGACDLDALDGLTPGQLPCFAVGEATLLQFSVPIYNGDSPVIPGTPGPWSDPYLPEVQADETITALYFEPDPIINGGAVPENGWPVVTFGHGITATKETVFPLVPALNASGIAVIAIDWALHGTPENGARGIRLPEALAPDTCTGTETFEDNPECYAPFITVEPASGRDIARQSVLDQLEVIELLKFCAANECSNPGLAAVTTLDVDADNIGYIGQSLGGILGSAVTSVSPDLKASVLNVAGADIVTILEETDSAALGCDLYLGQLVLGQILPPSALSACASGTIDSAALNAIPEYAAFRPILRWVVEAADAANFGSLIGTSGVPVLLQSVEGDTVVPNEATDILGAEIGLTETAGNTNGMVSAGITTESQLWVNYTSDASAVFFHSTLLNPGATAETALGLAQMQADAVEFLATHLVQ